MTTTVQWESLYSSRVRPARLFCSVCKWEMHLWPFLLQITEANDTNFAVKILHKIFDKPEACKIPGNLDCCDSREFLMALHQWSHKSYWTHLTSSEWTDFPSLFSTASHTLLIADTSCNYVTLSLSSCQCTPGAGCISDFAQ